MPTGDTRTYDELLAAAKERGIDTAGYEAMRNKNAARAALLVEVKEAEALKKVTRHGQAFKKLHADDIAKLRQAISDFAAIVDGYNNRAGAALKFKLADQANKDKLLTPAAARQAAAAGAAQRGDGKKNAYDWRAFAAGLNRAGYSSTLRLKDNEATLNGDGTVSIADEKFNNPQEWAKTLQPKGNALLGVMILKAKGGGTKRVIDAYNEVMAAAVAQKPGKK